MCDSEIAEKTPATAGKTRPQLEVADILAQYLPAYQANKKLSEQQNKAVDAILACRARLSGVFMFIPVRSVITPSNPTTPVETGIALSVSETNDWPG